MIDAMELGLRERKRRDTRRALQHAILSISIERGYDRVTIEDVCRVADVSPRTFFNYFTSKEDAVLGAAPGFPSEGCRALRAGGVRRGRAARSAGAVPLDDGGLEDIDILRSPQEADPTGARTARPACLLVSRLEGIRGCVERRRAARGAGEDPAATLPRGAAARLIAWSASRDPSRLAGVDRLRRGPVPLDVQLRESFDELESRLLPVRA